MTAELAARAGGLAEYGALGWSTSILTGDGTEATGGLLACAVRGGC